MIEDREFQFWAAKTNQSTALLAVEEGFSRDQTSNRFSREDKKANPMRRIMLSRRNAVLVFLLVFGLYESKVLAQAARGSYTTTADVS